MLNSLFSGILQGIFGLVSTLVTIVLTPINVLVDLWLPDFSQWFQNFTNFVNLFGSGIINYIYFLLPTGFRTLLILWFTMIVIFYGLYYTYKLLSLTWDLLHKIKFW